MRHASMSRLLWMNAPALAEALVRLIEMTLHRGARALRVVRRDRLQHRAVLADRRAPKSRRIVVILEPLEELAAALVPQKPDHVHERGVPGRLGDAQVELAIGGQRL